MKQTHANIDNLTLRERALTVASFLRAQNLTGIKEGRDYHRLEHNFLGLALDDPDHNSLPLISAAIFCYIARRVGLRARPCGFPFHVHVVIRPPRGFDMDGTALEAEAEGDPMYMDPSRSANETPLSDLRAQLDFLGASTEEQAAYLAESLTSEIVLRCSKNILYSVKQAFLGMQWGSMDITSARYAALWASMLFTGSSDLRQHLHWLMETFATEFPFDVYLVEHYIVPLFRGMVEHEHLLDSLHVMRAVDEIPKQVRRRAAEPRRVAFRVGQVMSHRRYQYRAIITGWDAECGAGEQWMRRMGVDQLQAGRHQSFYTVLYVWYFPILIPPVSLVLHDALTVTPIKC